MTAPAILRPTPDLTTRRVTICACGAAYHDTPDGRRTHQILHGHRVTPEATP